MSVRVSGEDDSCTGAFNRRTAAISPRCITTTPPTPLVRSFFEKLTYEINAALVRVLSDSTYRQELAARSRAVFRDHLPWPVIAAQFAAKLRA